MTTSIKKYAVLTCALALAITFSLCFCSCIRLVKMEEPSGRMSSKEYTLEGFSGISAAKRIVLHYSVGEEYSVKAEGPENMMEALMCSVSKDNVLTLEVERGERFNVKEEAQKVYVWVTAPKVNRFSATADAALQCDTINGLDNLSIETFNSSSFFCDSIQAENISISTYNGSTATIESFQGDILTASAFNAGSIKMKGSIENMMSLEAYNGSSISFTGNATTVNAEAFNGANIQLDGEFQTKRVSEFNGAHISIGDKKIYLKSKH